MENQQVLDRTMDYLSFSSTNELLPDDDEREDDTVSVSGAVEMGYDPSRPPERGFNARYLRWRTRRAVEHLVCRLVLLLLILLDVIVVIIDLSNRFPASTEHQLAVISFTLSCVFVVEVALRIFALGPKHFFDIHERKAWWNIMDLSVVLLTFISASVDVAMGDHVADSSKLVVVLRMFRVVRIFRMCTVHHHLKTATRQITSQNKRRYQEDGFDLDLCYITERVIAMSFPSSGPMSLYRNPISEVSRFFTTKHPGHYRLYNLCSERTYDVSYFNGQVERIPIDDHNPPTLQQMLDFKSSALRWLAEDPENVLAVHCKGGKGRTGALICVYLVETGLFSTAGASLDYFGGRRTDLNVGRKFQGVETPSQSRYVGYYEWMLRHNGHRPPSVTDVRLSCIVLRGLRTVGRGDGTDLTFTLAVRRDVQQDKQQRPDVRQLLEHSCNKSTSVCQYEYSAGSDTGTVRLSPPVVVSGDVRLLFRCSSKSVPKGYEKAAFYFWFNTGFIDDSRHLFFTRDELDNPHKSKTWKVFTDSFSVECLFT